MLLSHPHIYLDASGDVTDALLIRDGQIRATGDAARSKRNGDESAIEPDAACLFPALGDAHCHPWGMGRRPGTVDLRGAADSAELLARLEDSEGTETHHDWVLGRNWDDRDWPSGDGLDRRDLDRALPDRPVCLRRVDNHAALVDSQALERAGRSAWRRPGSPPSIDGGRVDADAAGRATGLLVDAAMEPVIGAIPDRTVEEDRRMFLETAEQFHEFGVASVHIALSAVDRIEMVEKLFREGRLPLRSYLLADADDERFEALHRRGPIDDARARYACRGVKFFADGALGSGGADLLAPYRDGSTGVVATDLDELTRRSGRLLRSGWQVAVHAIGDAGVRRVLDAFGDSTREQRRRLRPRVEHAQMVADADVERFDELNAAASIQPIHLRSDATWLDDVLDADQQRRLFRWRDLQRATILAAGSDFPIEDPNPWHGIATALNRIDADGEPFQPDQRLDREQILRAYTRGAARAAHWGARLGTLRPGFEADIAALDRDPLHAAPSEIWETRAKAVWIAGERIR
ncbi:MAG: amidohydrolase [Bradymonadaceae bacterium]